MPELRQRIDDEMVQLEENLQRLQECQEALEHGDELDDTQKGFLTALGILKAPLSLPDELNALSTAWDNACVAWEQLSNDKQEAITVDSYPFTESFDEMAFRVGAWVEEVTEALK